MIKVILFDCDGPIIKRDKYFSQRLLDLGFELNMDKVQNFFENEFLLCETGKADLKQELAKRIKDWGVKMTLEQLLDFWFSGEVATDKLMLKYITELRKAGVACHLATDQEQYRAEYIWKTVGLEKILQNLYSSSNVGFLKRKTEFWEEVNKSLGEFDKRDILVLDDDQRAIDSVNAFGFNAEFYTSFEDFKKVMEEKYLIYT